LRATQDQSCDAAQTIMTWIALDTAGAHKLVETYAAGRCAVAPKSGSRAIQVECIFVSAQAHYIDTRARQR
jgi:hypothetical protein